MTTAKVGLGAQISSSYDTASLMLGAVLVMLGGVAPAVADPSPAAPAVDGAAAGGAVIVVLKDQHADITCALADSAPGLARTRV